MHFSVKGSSLDSICFERYGAFFTIARRFFDILVKISLMRQGTSHCKQFSCNSQVIHNNSVALDYFLVALDQQVAFPIRLDIVAKDHFPINVCKNSFS